MDCDVESKFKGGRSAVIDYECLPCVQEEVVASLPDTTDPYLISEHLQDLESASALESALIILISSALNHSFYNTLGVRQDLLNKGNT